MGANPPTRGYDGSERWREPPAMGRTSPTLRRAWPRDGPLAAICVQNVDVQCVLQFTLIHAAGCVLHRRTSRVIHRLKLSFRSFAFSDRRSTPTGHPRQLGDGNSDGTRSFRFAPKVINERKERKKRSRAAPPVRTAGLFKPSPGRREACEPQLPPRN